MADDDEPLPLLTLGPLVLDRDSARLSSWRGHFNLNYSQLTVIERLMRRPGAVVSRAALVEALYRERDEPANAGVIAKMHIVDLRAAIRLLVGGEVRIRTELEGAYVIEAVG